MTEPGAGSDLKSLRTRAVRDGDDYLISGQKTFISNGQCADLIVVACQAPGGLSLLVVETDRAPGFARGRNLKKVGREAQDTSELFFEDVRVPAESLLGGVEGRGFEQLTAMLPQERLVIAAMGLAMMERAFALTVEYVRQRTAFARRCSITRTPSSSWQRPRRTSRPAVPSSIPRSPSICVASWTPRALQWSNCGLPRRNAG